MRLKPRTRLHAAELLASLLLGAAPAWAQDASGPPPPAPSSQGLPGASLYNLDLMLETADGERRPLASLRGGPVLLTLFYARCTSLCPMVTEKLKALEGRVEPAIRTQLRLLLVSLDPAHDEPAALKHFAQLHHIEAARWILARTRPEDVRVLAAVLGVHYRQLPDQSINHDAVTVLLDADGVVRERATALQEIDDRFLEALHRLATAGGTARP